MSENEDAFIWSHKKFEIGHNGNQIVDVNLTSESKVKLKPDTKITFTYEVNTSIYALQSLALKLNESFSYTTIS